MITLQILQNLERGGIGVAEAEEEEIGEGG